MRETEHTRWLVWAATAAIAAAIIPNCANDDALEVPHNYWINVDYHGDEPIGGIVFELADAGRAVDSSDIVWKTYTDGYTVRQVHWSATTRAWRFIMLAKRSSLAYGEVLELTASDILLSIPRIVEACDDNGIPLSPADFEITLHERIRRALAMAEIAFTGIPTA